MPISHKHKLIFIHIPKCAGQSIWKALDLDVDFEVKVNLDTLISFRSPVLQHLLPKELKSYIDSETWNTYKKFTIIRDPYDRVVSDYHWLRANYFASLTITIPENFDDFLSMREEVVRGNKYSENMFYDHFYPMSYYFEEIEYDYVIRFENIDKEFEVLNLPNKLLKINSTVRGEFQLTQEQKDRIYELYKEDFIKFGYEK